MSKVEAKKIIKRYAKALKEADYPFSALYLFGSYAKGRAHAWSDIDVAVVSDALKNDRDNTSFLLWKMRRAVDTRIEPHGFTVKEFANEADPLAYEIKKTGIRIE
ncbi:MAG: nucleotidyltransferase domain-containing protein [Candidatus Uhrbacteria bacterium]|nr:nucleotidyltransferase domain-containing protein [Candidatus Uhrbacteria bacterium]